MHAVFCFAARVGQHVAGFAEGKIFTLLCQAALAVLQSMGEGRRQIARREVTGLLGLESLERSGLPAPDLVTFNSALSQALRQTAADRRMAHYFLEQMPSRRRAAGGRLPGCCRRCVVAGWEEVWHLHWPPSFRSAMLDSTMPC